MPIASNLLPVIETLTRVAAGDVRSLFPVRLPDILRDIENEYIDAALEQTGGNRQAAATILGLQRTTLVEKLRRRDAEAAKADLLGVATTAG